MLLAVGESDCSSDKSYRKSMSGYVVRFGMIISVWGAMEFGSRKTKKDVDECYGLPRVAEQIPNVSLNASLTVL